MLVREPAVAALCGQFAQQYSVFLDDVDRPAEREILRSWGICSVLSPEVRSCIESRVPDAAVGTLEDEAADTPVVVDVLPGVGTSGQRAEAVLWVDDHPVVVGSGADDPGRGAVVWSGLDGTNEWFRLAGDALGGPGYQ